MNAPALQLQDVTLRFGAHLVLQGVNLQVPKAAWIAVLGPNASGKTTLLRAVAGQLPPARGQILLDQRPLYPLAQWKGTLPALASPPEQLPPFLTVRQCLDIHAEAGGLGATPEATLALCAQIGLAAHAHRLVRHCSLGTRQKLSLALALMSPPALLLLDEVFNGLDIGSAVVLKQHLRALKQTGTSILLATHSLDLVQDCCDGLVLVDEGRVVLQWDAAALRTHPDARSLEAALAAALRRPADAG